MPQAEERRPAEKGYADPMVSRTRNQRSVMAQESIKFFPVFIDGIVIPEHRSLKNRKESKMTQSTINTIQAILRADETVTEEQAKSILRCCKEKNTRRHLINAREACSILSCSRPTLRFLVKQGRLEQINYSSRKVRFDFEEVQRFANNGAQE